MFEYNSVADRGKTATTSCIREDGEEFEDFGFEKISKEKKAELRMRIRINKDIMSRNSKARL